MVNMKTCPLCKKENLEDAAICINCGFDLNPSFSASATDKPDWLQTLRSDPENPTFEMDNSATNDFNDLQMDPDSPDWLSRIRERKQQDEDFEDLRNEMIAFPGLDKKPNGTDELIDSLRSVDSDSSTQGDDSDELIKRLRIAGDDPPISELQHEEAQFSPPQPIDEDWISRLASVNPPNELELSDPTVNEKNKQVPGWIQKHPSQTSKENKEKENSQNPVSQWIERFGSSEDLPAQPETDDSIPDWIQSNDLEDVTSELPTGKEGIPSWLTDEDQLISETIIEEQAGNKPEWLTEIEQETEEKPVESEILPDWVTEASESEPVKSEPESGGTPVSKPESTENRDQLQSSLKKLRDRNDPSIVDKNNKGQPEIAKPPFQLDQVPGWLENNEDLINTSFFDDKETKESITIDESSAIEPGELPAWLKAMRPLEAIVPNISSTQEKKPVERSGPLAGLKGVLSSQESSQRYAPPPMYSSTLTITEKEKNQAAILDSLFVETVEPKSQKTRKISVFNLIVRLVFPLILLAALAYAFMKPVNITGRPIIFPAETVRFASIINGLILNSDSAPSILIVTESEGASFAELNILTKNVFERLLIKDSKLTIVSSSPNGALLGEVLVNNASTQNPMFDSLERVTNLGYLPGDTSGVQSFLYSVKDQSTGNTVLPYDAVLLVTDNPDRGKVWIEQINLVSPQSIILAAVTSQSIPLLSPYVDSEQIDGMIGGLYGSASYAQLNQNDLSPVWKYWDLQKSGVLVCIVFLLIGILYSFINTVFLTKPKTSR